MRDVSAFQAGQHPDHLCAQLTAVCGGQRIPSTMNFFSSQLGREKLGQNTIRRCHGGKVCA